MSLATNVTDLATRVATEAKSLRTLLNGNSVDNAALTTTAKGNLILAINEVAAAVAGASGIDDGTIGTTTSWSSSKTQTEIQAATAALINAAPGALDTLDELAAALGDDPNFAATITTALGKRVRFDAAQTLTDPEKIQARTNIGAASAVDVGDTTTNFVTTFESGLV